MKGWRLKVSGLFYFDVITTVNVVTQICCLRTFTTDTTGQLDVLWHDCHTLGVNGTQVGIFKESNQVGLGGFLKGQDGRTLESKIGLEILGDLTDKTLEWQLADEKVGGLLVTTDLTEGDCGNERKENLVSRQEHGS